MYISELISVDSRLRNYLKYFFRCIDDLYNRNGRNNFDDVCREIYQEFVILERPRPNNRNS